jgi:FtsP/CotA-like multicopper oxidase with cupredoxin domain
MMTTTDRLRRAAAALALTAAGATLADPAPRVFELPLADGKAQAGVETLRVTKGDQVELRWSSNRPIMLHLHGYNIERKVAPRAPAAMAFRADVAGRFPVSEHTHGAGHHRAVLYLEVHP